MTSLRFPGQVALAALMVLPVCSDLAADEINAPKAAPSEDHEFQSLAQLMELGVRSKSAHDEGFGTLYREHCSVCHGEDFQGSAQGTVLVGKDVNPNTDTSVLFNAISAGNVERGMPAWRGILTETEIKNLAVYISERRQGLGYETKNFERLNIPSDVIKSDYHDFEFEVVWEGLDPEVFSIAPLPDGSILVSERRLGLLRLDPSSGRQVRINGTPTPLSDAVDEFTEQERKLALGLMMEVKPDPDYEDNGWIYLSYDDWCRQCNDASLATGTPVSMLKLIRGRIRNDEWIDSQDLWEVDKPFYSSLPTAGAAGRLAFDDNQQLFFSVGMKSSKGLRAGIQDLSEPYGKIHRIRKDGGIPPDNPFRDEPGAMESIWTLGHRTPQGLEFDPVTEVLWSTEMGPRGGDEVNRLEPGLNYGWPLVSNGVNYDGTPLNYAERFGIEFDPAELTGPFVDFTPAPAISSFIVYRGDTFPDWKGDLIIGSLKASTLYRIRPGATENRLQEILISDLGRIRDVEEDRDGSILLLLEHVDEAIIVRIRPEISGR